MYSQSYNFRWTYLFFSPNRAVDRKRLPTQTIASRARDGTVPPPRLLCRANVDGGSLVDRLYAVDDDLVPHLDTGADHHIRPDGLSKLHFFLEGTPLWRLY